MLASLNSFTARQEEEKLKKTSSEQFTVMQFYHGQTGYLWIMSLPYYEFVGDRKQDDPASRIEMAGGRGQPAVCAQESLEPETSEERARQYRNRVRGGLYHDDSTFQDGLV